MYIFNYIKSFGIFIYKNNVEGKMLMENKKIHEKIVYETEEDYTKYGEFISSHFAWMPMSEQKEKAQRLENLTKD